MNDGDTAALAEIAAAQDALLDRDPSDVRSVALLAMRRDGLIERNRHVPVDLPAVWAPLGEARPLIGRALRLAGWQASTEALAGVEPAALTELAAAFSPTDDLTGRECRPGGGFR